MAFPRLSASMLLASLILLLYWTTSSAQSHDPTSFDLSPPSRVKRQMPDRTRELTAGVTQVLKDSLTVAKDYFARKNIETLSGVMKSLANVASLAPGIGGLVSSALNLILAIAPQENPLKALREGFAEVNRRLDSLSIQISNLATDVEWFNYASVYSQDEVRILTSWKKFNEFRDDSLLVKSADDKLRLAEIFVNYYENTATEASVANLYHYLTVSNTSLSGNLNELLRKKFKCGVREIYQYNAYFSSLLWKGMFLNQLYWELIGLNRTGKEAEHVQMSKTVLTAQMSAINSCLNNYTWYLQKDMEEIGKALSLDDKNTVAEEVKKALDKKYFWYNWVVLVYKTDYRGYYILLNPTVTITTGTITVAVGYTLKATHHEYLQQGTRAANKCFKDTLCDHINQKQINECIFGWSYDYDNEGIRHTLNFTQYFKAMHVIYGSDFAEAPKPPHQHDCKWGWSTSKMSIYYSRRLSVCDRGTCTSNGNCTKLLDSNESLCVCTDGYFGNRCEKSIGTRNMTLTDIHHVPDISTIDTKLTKMESKLEKKLEEILKKYH